ncbi:serine/threonine-protein kinase [Microbacterium neungamense]|uniref:serine/threonine-protein kinase n=1 Tax=Microbacterium neungamense TaxID=2810535 RepID=UPI00217D61B1|nr:serine/threonine-protein kinase [Microbacterium neungamense]UWF77723.1 serine/threonine protein kinase [Microbacterium neungamense]
MNRPPSPPPDLPGFTYLEPLGTGGFADVFLYEQHMPRRRVAVKVLLAERISSGAAQEFTDEANVMAMLSTHPAIVTIYQAGVAADGRPYLVMEYCPRPNLQIRARREPFSVAEALRVGIQVAGAVETAHRAGVLHRDIKPANILVTEYNRPALTDFGIASTTGATGEASGMSIPWSPPESFADPPTSGPRTDVWALGATLYTLLAGRSPFERPGERNTSADLIERIERAALPRLNRADSPDSLQAVLERSMAKNPDDRYPSAVAFARALQKVQIELAHSVTPIDIVDEHPHPDEVEDDGDGLTRVRQVQSISPEAQTATRPSAATERKRPDAGPGGIPRFDAPPASPPAAPPPSYAPSQAPAPAAEDDRTLLRPPTILAPEAPAAQAAAAATEAAPASASVEHKRSRGMPWWGWLITALGVLMLVLVLWFSSSLADMLVPEPAETSAEPVDPQDPISAIVPPVTELTGSRSGETVSFRWTNPDPQEGDSYIWYQVTLDGPGDPANTTENTVTLPGAHPERTCIEVILKRADGRASPESRGCVE